MKEVLLSETFHRFLSALMTDTLNSVARLALLLICVLRAGKPSRTQQAEPAHSSAGTADTAVINIFSLRKTTLAGKK